MRFGYAHVRSPPAAALPLWVGHVGDSRAVLCEDGRAVGLTRDHRAGDPAENKRENGGMIALGRVCGVLMVTRSLGDFGLKGDDVETGAAKPVARFALSPRSQFLLLACDGVFDVMDNAEA
eukprot:gene21889-37113_t